jgi:hypothetical protein
MVAQCSNCFFGRIVPADGSIDAPVAPGSLCCQRYAPQALLHTVTTSARSLWLWPVVLDDYWCGDYSATDPGVYPGATGRKITTTDTTYYISSTGNDANDGLTSATSWLTLAKAITYVNNSLNVQPPTAATPVNLTINIGAGTFAGVMSYLDFSSLAGGTLTIAGNGIGSTIITDGLQLYNMAGIFGLIVQGVTLQGTVATPVGLFTCKTGFIQNSEFALTAGLYGVITEPQGSMGVSNCTVSGSGAQFVHMDSGDFASIQLTNITYSTPTFSDMVFNIGLDCYLDDVGINAGSATGKNFVCNGIYHLHYGAGNIQAGVGTVSGTMGATGQVQDSTGAWHGNIATPVP